METFDLLQKYLRENTSYLDVTLTDYEMNGSVIKLKYYYNPHYDWAKEYVSYGNIMEVEVLDYITWVYNLCKS